MAGRKSLKTPETIDRLIEALATGHTRKDACTLADISDETLSNWMKKDLDFLEAVKKAELVAKDQCIKIVRQAALKSWQAGAWYLERKYRDEFAQRQEVTGRFGGAIELANLEKAMRKLSEKR